MKIPFEPEYRRRYYQLLDEVFESNFLSEGEMIRRFEENFARFVGGGTQAAAMANAGLGLTAALEAAGVQGGEVVVPSNTFMATPLAARRAGADVVFADCNREDLCLSLTDLKKRITPRTRAVVVVHIGGHLAFEIEAIASFLERRGIPLIEDAAHAHGASLHAARPEPSGWPGCIRFTPPRPCPWAKAAWWSAATKAF